MSGRPIRGCEVREHCVPVGVRVRFIFLEIAAIDVRLSRTNFGEGAAGAALEAAQ